MGEAGPYRTGTKLGTTIYCGDESQPCAWVPNNPALAGTIVGLLNQDAAAMTAQDVVAPRDRRRCGCGCCHRPDYGACPNYTAGDIPDYANPGADAVRCAYCDHGAACHERDRYNRYFNTPLGQGRRSRNVLRAI